MNNYILSFQLPHNPRHGGINTGLVKEIAKKLNYKTIIISQDFLNDNEITHNIAVPFPISNSTLDTVDSPAYDFFKEYVDNHLPKKINKIIFFFEYHFWFSLKPFRSKATEVIAFHRLISSRLNKVVNEWGGDYNPKMDTLLKLEEQMLKDSTTVFVGSEGIKKTICEDYPQIENLIDKTQIVPIYSSKLVEYQNFVRDIDINSKDICFVGRTDFQKGFWRIKQTTNEYNILVPNNPFNIWNSKSIDYKIWPGDDDKNLNWHKYIKNSAFCLFPAIYETRGLIIQEAMSLGMIPIVQNNQYGIAEQVIDKQTGFLVDFDTPIDTIINDIKLSYSADYLTTMSNQNRQFYKTKSFINSFDILL